MGAQEDQVLEANRAFYRAFESLELERMDAVWAHTGLVTCVHPGWPIAVGWSAVRESFSAIFDNTLEIHFSALDERVDVAGELAWVVCIERVTSGRSSGAVQVTNVFRREPDGWKMVHHHGSPLAEPAPQPRLKGIVH